MEGHTVLRAASNKGQSTKQKNKLKGAEKKRLHKMTS